jgi:hypothetical protein
MTYVERLKKGYHQAITKIFANSYDGKKATVGSLELIVDEATIASTTSLPRTGQNWFKTTVTKNLDFRSYLNVEILIHLMYPCDSPDLTISTTC